MDTKKASNRQPGLSGPLLVLTKVRSDWNTSKINWLWCCVCRIFLSRFQISKRFPKGFVGCCLQTRSIQGKSGIKGYLHYTCFKGIHSCWSAARCGTWTSERSTTAACRPCGTLIWVWGDDIFCYIRDMDGYHPIRFVTDASQENQSFWDLMCLLFFADKFKVQPWPLFNVPCRALCVKNVCR